MKTVPRLLVLAALAGGTTSIPTAKADDKDKLYPLATCIVSGEKLGEHGRPYVFTHEGREIRLCCQACLKDFNKEPAAYLKKFKQ